LIGYGFTPLNLHVDRRRSSSPCPPHARIGKPVNPSNLPRDWRAQTTLILSDLHARGIRTC